MKLWMRKITVVLVTIMTLGLYVPPLSLDVDAEENKDALASNPDSFDGATLTVTEIAEDEIIPDNDEDYFIETLTEKAKEQTITKLGPRIAEQIDNEFFDDILHNMEDVVQSVLVDAGEDASEYIGITEHPSKGFGEKIFNIYDYRTHKDVARFHVRRDNRPLEGYWFNFHYHLSNDGFEEHHVIGEIFWDKNVPPKWMS